MNFVNPIPILFAFFIFYVLSIFITSSLAAIFFNKVVKVNNKVDVVKL